MRIYDAETNVRQRNEIEKKEEETNEGTDR